MACSIERNTRGKITGVKTANGEVSELFNAIHSNIFLTTPELSLQLMTTAFNDEAEGTYKKGDKYTYSTGEPKLFYKGADAKEYETIEQTIISNGSGSIVMGFKDPVTDTFQQIASFSTDSSDKSRLLNDQVKEGVLSAERVLGEDGVTRYQGKGSFPETRYATAKLFEFNAMTDAGIGNVKIHKNGTIEVDFPTDFVIGVKDGKKEAVHIDEVVGKDYDNQKELLSIYHSRTARKLTEDSVQFLPKSNVKENIQSLYNFLESIGFTKTTLDNYKKNYNTKYGEDPDINALTDIANKVVAFKDGNIPVDQLTEEVAHIAIEAYNDQNSIASALSNVHLSPEYNQHAAYYRQKYAPFFEGFALEEQVRKEILGKILAKELANRFTTEIVNEDQGYLLGKIRDIWENFIRYIQGRIKGHHKNTLSELNKKIADSIFANDSQSFGNSLDNNKSFFYSAMSTNSRNIESKLIVSRKLIDDLFKTTGQKKYNQHELDKISDLMEETDVISSVNAIIGIAEKQVGLLESNIKEAEKNGTLLSIKDRNIHMTLSENLLPQLNSIKADLGELLKKGEIKDARNAEIARSLINTIIEIKAREDAIQPFIDNDMEDLARKIYEEAYGGSANMTPEEKAIEDAKFEGGMKDLGLFAKLLGLQTHSQNPVIQLIANKVVELHYKVNKEFTERVTEDIDSIYTNGREKFQKNLLKKDNGKATYYFTGPVDHHRIDKAIEAEQLRILTDPELGITGKTKEEIEKLLKRQSFSQIITDPAKYKVFKDLTNKFKETINQRPRTDAYYKQKDENFKKANVAPFTQETLSNFSARRFEIEKPYRNNADGTVDKSRLTEGEKKSLSDLKKDYEVAKSAYSNTGDPKEGLRTVKKEELTEDEILKLPYKIADDFDREIVVLRPGIDADSLSDEARIALDMSNLAMVYAEKLAEGSKSRTPIKGFKDKITDIENTEDSAYEWVTANASIGLTADYYTNLGSTVSYDKKAQEFIDKIEDSVEKALMQDRLNSYKELNRRKKNLLRQNRQMSNQLETDVVNMTNPLKAAIIDLDAKISNARSDMNLPKTLFTKDEKTTSRSLNEHYSKLLKDSNLSEFDFALQNMTEDNKKKCFHFSYEMSARLTGKRRFIGKSYEDFFKEALEDGTIDYTMSTEETINALQNSFARNRVASYFQKYAPEGYDEAIESLKSGEVKISDLLDKDKQEAVFSKYPALRYIEVRPDYSWGEDLEGEDFVNEGYKKGGYRMKPKEEWFDKEWFNRYGISIKDYLVLESDDPIENPDGTFRSGVRSLVATQNIEEFELWKTVIKLREDTLKLYTDSEDANKYQRPQQSTKLFEKVFSNGVVGNAKKKWDNGKDLLKDMVSNRSDDQDYGAQEEGVDLRQQGSDVNVRVIPKYFQRKLESPEQITDNVIGSGLLDLKQALIYKERNSLEKDVRALEWKLSKQKLINNGSSAKKGVITKEGAVSDYYWKGKEIVDHSFYGIQQTRSYVTTIAGQEVDLTRVLNTLQGFSVFSNLAFNPFVDIVGATTGMINNFIDKQVGDYYHKSSVKRAEGQVREFMGAYAGEMGKVQKDTKANAIFEYFQLVDPSQKLENAQMGRGARLAQRSPFLMSKMSNMAITPKILFAILNDYRFSDGNFISFDHFTSKQKQAGNTDIKNIELAWDKIKEDSFFDNVTITTKGVKYNDKFASKFENPKNAFDKISIKITSKAQQVIQSVDGVLNEQSRVAAQRDIATNILLQHKGWALIALTRRFKKKAFNVAADQMEEGHYITIFNVAKARIKSLRGGTPFKEYREGMSDLEKKNFKRVTIEMAILASAAYLGSLLLAADDEDDSWAENLAQLIYLRTFSEYNTAQIVGLPGTVYETFKSPIVAIETLAIIEPIHTIYAFTQEDSEGNNKGVKDLIKLTPFKRIKQLNNLQETIDQFRHYNDITLLNLGESKKSEE